jgi:hypothetical protein
MGVGGMSSAARRRSAGLARAIASESSLAIFPVRPRSTVKSSLCVELSRHSHAPYLSSSGGLRAAPALRLRFVGDACNFDHAAPTATSLVSHLLSRLGDPSRVDSMALPFNDARELA